MRRESPFIFEDAVPPEKFFDRKEEIEFFIRNLEVKRKMLICIVAPLKYGKSSLMLRYYDILRGYPDIIPIYINLKRIKSPISYIVEELRKYSIDLSEELEVSLRREDLLPLFQKINETLVENKKWLFLLFDEFHLLPELLRNEGFYKNFSDELIFGFIRGLAEGARISYIVCGSIIEPLMKALDVWGGRFQIMYLGPFSEDDALEMIKKLFAEGGISIEDEYARIIAEAAGFHPFYIQFLGHHIFVTGEINRKSIRLAKQRLFEFLSPLFFTYLERIRELGREYIDALAKLMRNDPLTVDDRVFLGRLMRMGILKPKNARFEFVDPLFRRYMEHVIKNLEPSEVTIVGHWAERIVGNYLLRKGYTPYYSHDSRGAFDIYVRIRNYNVGIQVKYSVSGEAYLSEKEYKEIQETAKNLGWIPILALVQKAISFFPIGSHEKYLINEGYKDIEEALRKYLEQDRTN